ncbi:cell envelope integrity protein TolA [Asticcacaulis sp. DW145]|uniref:cell envelope integrity protein TolA n=1 Tax=Asticcacaulis sp. DW145 TaxID=3095608 RepID=UPI0030CE8827
MSKRDRVKYAAFGFVALAILAAFIFAAWQTRPILKPENFTYNFVWDCKQKKAPKADSENHSAEKQSPKTRLKISIEDKADADEAARAKAECENVKRAESDLRAQWLAAESARSNYWLGFVNFIALVLTLAAASWAAWESHKSAEATVEAVNLARKEYIATHRPRLRFNTCEFDKFGPNIPLTCNVTMINFGETNANIFLISAGFIIKNGDFQNYLGPDTEDHEQRAIIPGEQFFIEWTTNHSFSPYLFRSIINGDTELFYDGTVHYRDANGTIRVTGFTRRYDRNRRKFRKLPAGHDFEDGEYES